ncbi:hypothetical protein KNP414_04407 [Paenibacillus mucilaginosus KNP414]|uniref:Uncharacterized protein n=1 Tax=Paenibacillus mucilaginosus (strain KNP414) TaxID=1036673 RepID=F8F6I5_PAEMK|nr:hypothetical protein KNP414_04407 [Paenibacillus mucilaginosus KNP414]
MERLPELLRFVFLIRFVVWRNTFYEVRREVNYKHEHKNQT